MKGIRKTASATVTINKNSKERFINGVTIEKYFNNMERYISRTTEALSLLELDYGFRCKVIGSGLTGQSEAMRYAITRELSFGKDFEADNFKDKLKKYDFYKCDTRFVERKKTGKPKARKSPTFVKR